MPLYDYQCLECGNRFEDMANYALRDSVFCACGELAVRLITGGSFLLKGGGWSKPGHYDVMPPQSDPDLDHNWKTNYYNCTPEDVHKN